MTDAAIWMDVELCQHAVTVNNMLGIEATWDCYFSLKGILNTYFKLDFNRLVSRWIHRISDSEKFISGSLWT